MTHTKILSKDQGPLKNKESSEGLRSRTFADGSAIIATEGGVALVESQAGYRCSEQALTETSKQEN